MKTLTKVKLINWHTFSNEEFEIYKNALITGENGTGKTNLLDAISYFYYNLTGSNISTEIFDENNHYSNEVRISLTYDLSEFVKISKSNTEEIPDFGEEEPAEKSRYSGYYKAIISMASKVSNKKLRVELSQVKGRSIRWNCTYEERLIFKSLFPIFYIDTRNLDVTQWGYIWDILGELEMVSNTERKNVTDKSRDVVHDAADDKSQTSKE